jgi:1-acyl-sn-glycerol-3-phosphate acyltransferase
MRGLQGGPVTPEGAARPRYRLARQWRAFRTGLAFAVFGIGAFIVAFVIIPVLRFTLGTRSDPTVRVQSIVHRGFRWFEWFVSILGLIRVSRVGFERLAGDGPRFVIANHPTLIDVILLGTSLRQADCVVKKAALRNLYLRRIVTAAGYVPNDEGDRLVDACVRKLRAGRTLLMFPEGTRSPRGELGRIQRGAARVALRSGVPLLPVVITCDPPMLMKGQPWYEVPERTARLTLVAQQPIDPAVYLTDPRSIPAAARRLSREIQAAFLGLRGDASSASRPTAPSAVVRHVPEGALGSVKWP